MRIGSNHIVNHLDFFANTLTQQKLAPDAAHQDRHSSSPVGPMALSAAVAAP
jgi:hypothetical protein